MQLALAAAHARRLGAVRLLLGLALFVQAGYFAMQIQLFTDDLAKFSPRGNAYASIYYTLLGAHQLHVAVGMLLSLWIGLRLLGGLTRYRLVGLEAIAFYWHFVNVLAVCVVLTVLSPSL